MGFDCFFYINQNGKTSPHIKHSQHRSLQIKTVFTNVQYCIHGII